MMEAFRELQSDRPMSMAGLGMIPFTAIDAYARRYGIGDFEGFRLAIRTMEAVTVKAERDRQGGGSTGGSSDEREAMRRATQAARDTA